jgi:hypothetical protein
MAMAPRCASAGDFEFVVIGDTRPRFESQSFRPFEGLIAKINASKPALVVNLGDLIYGYGPPSKDRQWDKYEAVIKAFQGLPGPGGVWRPFSCLRPDARVRRHPLLHHGRRRG